MLSFGAATRIFDRLSIHVKSLSAPVVLSSCLLLISATSLIALQDTVTHIRTISREIVQQQQRVAALKDNVVKTEIQIQRYVAWASNQVSPRLMLKLQHNTEDGMKLVQKEIDDPATGVATELTGPWAKYASQVRDIFSIGSSDGSMATMMLGETDDSFAVLSRIIETKAAATSEALTNATQQLGLKADQSRRRVIFEACLGLLLSAVIAAFAVRSIANPISSITTRMKRLSAGDVSVSVGYQDRGDEVGEMARAIEIFRITAQHAKDLERATREADAQRSSDRTHEISQIAQQFRGSVADILERVTELTLGVRGKAEAVANSSRLTVGELKCSRETIEAAQMNVDQVAGAANELRATIQELVRQTSHVRELSNRTSQQTNSTKVEIHVLSDSIDQISSVVSFIQVVAQQTNLLALNATIEAARAGEAGRGFAVVAAEVKSLSRQVEAAAIEISEKIEAVQHSRDIVSLSTEQVIAAIHDLGVCSSDMAIAVEQQAAATTQISQSAQSAAGQSSTARDQSVSLNARADEANHLSGRLLEEARMLSDQASALGGKADEFLRYLATA